MEDPYSHILLTLRKLKPDISQDYDIGMLLIYKRSSQKIGTCFTMTQNGKKTNAVYETPCAIWCHLYNLKTMTNIHERVLLFVKFRLKPATLLKVTILHGYFSRFLNCTNDTKSCKASQ